MELIDGAVNIDSIAALKTEYASQDVCEFELVKGR
jgi:hypothetical protein